MIKQTAKHNIPERIDDTLDFQKLPAVRDLCRSLAVMASAITKERSLVLHKLPTVLSHDYTSYRRSLCGEIQYTMICKSIVYLESHALAGNIHSLISVGHRV